MTYSALYICSLSIAFADDDWIQTRIVEDQKNNHSKLVCNMYKDRLLYLQKEHYLNSNQHNTNNIEAVQPPMSISG